jgi:translation initiation factor IF-1
VRAATMTHETLETNHSTGGFLFLLRHTVEHTSMCAHNADGNDVYIVARTSNKKAGTRSMRIKAGDRVVAGKLTATSFVTSHGRIYRRVLRPPANACFRNSADADPDSESRGCRSILAVCGSSSEKTRHRHARRSAIHSSSLNDGITTALMQIDYEV